VIINHITLLSKKILRYFFFQIVRCIDRFLKWDFWLLLWIPKVIQFVITNELLKKFLKQELAKLQFVILYANNCFWNFFNCSFYCSTDFLKKKSSKRMFWHGSAIKFEQFTKWEKLMSVSIVVKFLSNLSCYMILAIFELELLTMKICRK
jgi:hypothetical protein